MKKIIVGGLLSAFLIISCQQQEKQPTQTEPKQQITQTQQKPEEIKPQQPQGEITQQQQQAQPKQPTTQQQPQEKQTENKAKSQQTVSIDGKSIFISKGCGACHQENSDTVGPSLKKIASAYAGDKGKLTAFLKGDGKPIVDPAKEAIMKPQLEVTKKLNSQELESLVDFILKH